MRKSRAVRKSRSLLRSRSFMFGASSLWVAVILVVFVFRGGLAVPVERAAEPVGGAAADLGERARAAVEVGDYQGAWRLYYEALRAAPEDVGLWYGLGVVLSRLEERAGAEEAFRYVVRNGQPTSEEVKLARQWLLSAGVLVEAVAFSVAAPAVDTGGDRAVLKGRATWGAPAEGRALLRAQLVLEGVSGAAEGKRYSQRVRLGQPYRFEGLPAGTYRLIGGAAGQRLWEVTLDVADGKEITLDLGQENSGRPDATIYL